MASKTTRSRTTRTAKKATKAAKPKVNVDRVHDEIAKRLWQAAEGKYNIRGVSNATGFHHESVRRWFQGMNAVAIAFVDPFCKATGTSIEWLLTGRGNMSKKGK